MLTPLECSSYHCTTALFFQNSPFGEPGGKRARWTGVTAPSSGERVAFGPAMSVLTQPGQQQLINTSSLSINGQQCMSIFESDDLRINLINYLKWMISIILTCLCQLSCVDFCQCDFPDFRGGVKGVAPLSSMFPCLHIANKLFHQTHQLCLRERRAGELITKVGTRQAR